jgi:hypothetical protein
MPETKAAEDQPYVWISADHVQNMAELHQVMVAVDPNTGAVLDPQPEYPVHEPEAPPVEPPPEARKSETKS